MKDSPDRRNRVAAITANYWQGTVAYAVAKAQGESPNTPQPVLPGVAVVKITGAILAALSGVTDPAALGLPPDSTPALQIGVICEDSPTSL